MRTILAAVTLILAGSAAFAANGLPDQACSKSFVARWQKDSERAMGDLPKRACIMRATAGPYVCDQEGCTQAEAYLENHRD